MWDLRASKTASGTLNVVFVVGGDRRGPSPAGRERARRLAETVESAGYRASVLAPGDGGRPATRAWRNQLSEHGFFNNPGLLLDVLDLDPDVVVLPTSLAAPSALLLGSQGVPVVLDFVRIEEDHVRTTKAGGVLGPTLRPTERVASRECEGILVTNPTDRQILLKRHASHPGRVLVYPTPVSPLGEPCRLGGELIWLRGGLAPEKKLLGEFRALLGSHRRSRLVTSLGESDWPKTWDRARCLIVGLLGGSGRRDEIARSLARGVPVLTTPHGFRGFEEALGAGIEVVAPEDLAKHALEYFEDAGLAAEQGRAGFEAWGARVDDGSSLVGLLLRASRAFIDRDRKVRMLREIPGAWPESKEGVRGFLERRPFKLGDYVLGGRRRRFLRGLG